MATFSSLDLAPHLLETVASTSFETPTPPQAHTTPTALKGRDLAAESQTGTGKTAAFVLPVLQRLAGEDANHGKPRVLVLTPTRELAQQIAEVFAELSIFAPKPVWMQTIIGGRSYDIQIDGLEAGVDVVVATPGRLLDLVEGRELDLSHVHTLVLDEADKLLDLGFQDELAAVLDSLQPEHHTMLFSATLPERVQELSERALLDPVVLRIGEEATPVEGIKQRVYQVDRDKRRLLLQQLARKDSWGKTMVFVATRRATENLAAKLRREGVASEALHGDLIQADRMAVLDDFKHGDIHVLIATDIAARGIDVPDLEVVVNFDLPRAPRDFTHRVGRTGRAGRTGLAISFVDHESEAHFRLIEKRTGIRVEREQVPGFELSGPAPAKIKGPPPTKGKRKSKKDKLREAAALQAAPAETAAPEAEE